MNTFSQISYDFYSLLPFIILLVIGYIIWRYLPFKSVTKIIFILIVLCFLAFTSFGLKIIGVIPLLVIAYFVITHFANGNMMLAWEKFLYRHHIITKNTYDWRIKEILHFKWFRSHGHKFYGGGVVNNLKLEKLYNQASGIVSTNTNDPCVGIYYDGLNNFIYKVYDSDPDNKNTTNTYYAHNHDYIDINEINFYKDVPIKSNTTHDAVGTYSDGDQTYYIYESYSIVYDDYIYFYINTLGDKEYILYGDFNEFY